MDGTSGDCGHTCGSAPMIQKDVANNHGTGIFMWFLSRGFRKFEFEGPHL